MNKKKRMFLIKLPYWLGIGADALWAVALLFPQVYGILTVQTDFNPDLQTKLIMGIGGSLMTGWTLLLIWAVINPIERRFIALLTVFPVIFGLLIVTLIGIREGNGSNIWILIKISILCVMMITSYILAGKMNKKIE